MSQQEIRLVSVAPSSAYRVSVTLTVEDVGALWAAAASRLLSAPGITHEDVIDTIGPRQDPLIAECLATLTAPAAIPGCTLEDYAVAETHQLCAAEPRRLAGWPSDLFAMG